MKKLVTTLAQKWPEYLLEILVITIGVLGAFGLNNWNESKQKGAQEQQILRQLLSDYEANLSQLDQKIAERQSIMTHGLKVLSYIDAPENVNKDSLIDYLAVLVVDPTFDPIENNLINSGNIHLIQNPNLNKLLTNWTSDLIALQEIEKIWTGITYEQYGPMLNEMGISRSVISSFWNDRKQNWILDSDTKTNLPIGKSHTSVPVEKILSDQKLEGLVTYAVSMNHGANVQSEALRRRIIEILTLINQELE
jgi:type II secretory pathway pseudopilin PulG